MAWEFRSGTPIYLQIEEILLRRICCGAYPLGGEVPSVRALALEFSVNPNTVQRVFASLEARGVVETRRTAGRRVTEDEAVVSALRNELAERIVAEAKRSLRELGVTDEAGKRIFEEEAI